MKKKNIVVDKIPEEYMIKSLGSGVSAECFLTSDGKVFKNIMMRIIDGFIIHIRIKNIMIVEYLYFLKCMYLKEVCLLKTL